jgi:hypothetical protein
VYILNPSVYGINYALRSASFGRDFGVQLI